LPGILKSAVPVQKMSRAVVIKYRFRGGHQIHVVAVYLSDKERRKTYSSQA